MNNKIKNIIIMIGMLILLGTSKIYAVNASFSVNKTSATVKIGETTTFSITATDCGGKFTITSSNTNVATVSSGEEWIENGTQEITINAKSAGTATITITASDVASTDEEVVTGTKKIDVVVPENENNNNTSSEPTTSTNTTTTTTSKSTEARLSNLGIKPHDFTGFRRNIKEYNVTVPNSASEVEVYAEKVDSKAKVEGTGKVKLKEGNNTVKVTVTAEAGNTETYTMIIKRKTAEEEEAENSEARLSNLGIKPDEYDFTGFKSETTEYSAEVPNDVDEIEVYATAVNSNAQITGTGMVELKEGLNKLTVEVIAVNGTKKTYTINVTRKSADGESETTENKFGLSSLNIEGITLTPSFKTGTYEYKVELTEDLQTLEIEAKANDTDATVEIYGNENLQEGENVITIQVSNKETDEMATYQIIVNKNLTETIQTSWLKPSTWGKEEMIKIAIIGVLCLLIICAIILKISISKGTRKSKKVDLPGAEELDKAMAEHQELSEDLEKESNTENKPIEQNVDNKTEDNNKNKFEENYIEEIAKTRFGEESEEGTKRKGRHF